MKVVISVLCCLMLVGCTSSITQEQKHIYTHVVDACYTVLEMAPADKDTRISTYLQAYQNGGLMSEGEVFVLKECIKRTESSTRWKK